jgi:hypothetical protein
MKNRYSRRRVALFFCLSALAALAIFVSPSSSGQGRARVRQDVSRSLGSYDELTLEPSAVLKQVRQTGRLTLSTARGTFELELEPSDVRADNYRAVAVDDNGVVRDLGRTPLRTYKGTVRGQKGAQARFSIDEQKIEGIIITSDELYFIEPEKNYSAEAGDKDFVFYPQSSVKQESFGECGTTLAHRVGERAGGVLPGGAGGGPVSGIANKGVTPEELFGPKPEVEIATEADSEYFQGSANNADTANNKILDIMNQVDGIYDAQLGIRMRVVFQRVWAVANAANDPYSGTDASAALDQFRNVYNGSFGAGSPQGSPQLPPNTPPQRDLAHMWTGRDFNGGTIGIAYIASVCDSPAFSYGMSQDAFDTTNIRRVVLTAHEIGHNFSAEHPDQLQPPVASCAGTIMNSSVNPNANFCPLSLDQITNHTVKSGSCLTRLTQPGCTYAVTPAYKRFGAEGGTASVSIATSLASCDWGVAESAPWLSVTAGTAGVGPGTSTFSAQPNAGGPLSTQVDIGGQKLTVVQNASPNCTTTLIGEGSTSGTLSAADCRSGQTERPTASADLYTFVGIAGQRVRIEMNASIAPTQSGTGLDTFLYLFAPDGTVVAENDDIVLGSVTNSRIPVAANTFFTLPQTGMYIIEATSFDDVTNDAGSYSLILSLGIPNSDVSIAGGGSLTVAEGVGPDGLGSEGLGFRTVTVSRSNPNPAASVDYATSNGTASATSDYTAAFGTLHFAQGEVSKSFAVFVTDDAFLEADETVNITLSNPVGVNLAPGASTAVLTISSDDTADGPSPVREQSFNTRFFVRQHYLDFLNREPDAGGMNFWTNGIDLCGPDAQCLLNKRVDTSAAFFLSIEFQETGYLVHRMYKTAYGEAQGQATINGVLTPILVPVVRLDEFLRDTQRIGLGVIVGTAGWPERLAANKAAFAQEFVARSRFTTQFPGTLTPTQFVDQLNTNAGNVLNAGERQALIDELTANNTPAGRASVLTKVAEDADLASAETNKAFVLMQYFGYLRRNPNDAPDANHSGYNFWLTKLNEFGGDFRAAQMVLAFIDSIEYKQRFGQP